MTERKLGVGVIGAGGIARLAHIPNYAKNPRVKLVAVADIDVAKARQVAEDFGIPNVYDNFEDLLANPEVEAVSVTTPPSAHAEPVIAAARAGKHVLCEKPIAMTLEEADAMVDAAEKAGVKFAMGYQHRFGTELPLVEAASRRGRRRAPDGDDPGGCWALEPPGALVFAKAVRGRGSPDGLGHLHGPHDPVADGPGGHRLRDERDLPSGGSGRQRTAH